MRLFKGKKGKVNPRQGPKGSRGIALFFLLTSALYAGWVLKAMSRTETRFPLYKRLGGPQSLSGLLRKISLPPGFDPQIVQPVASIYTD